MTVLTIVTSPLPDTSRLWQEHARRPGQLSEVANCFVFLASADSSFISGSTTHPNGQSWQAAIPTLIPAPNC
ncbi:hypothetical protein V8E36_009608 [Tilletia maclaganii]